MTRPGSSECESESAMSASRRRTTNAPRKPLVKPINAPPRSARCMNSWRKGSRSQSISMLVRMFVAAEDAHAVRALDVFLVKGLAHRSGSDKFAIQQKHAIENIGHRGEIVMRRDDELALFAQAAKQCAQVIL